MRKDVHYSIMFLKKILQKQSFSKHYLCLKQWQRNLTQSKGDVIFTIQLAPGTRGGLVPG